MICPGTGLTVYLCRVPVAMCKQIDGLALLVQEAMDLNPFDQALFVFGSRQRDKVQLLFWERKGFVVWYKRLERERFKRPTHLEGDKVTLTGQELNWLLDGVNLKAMQPHKALDFQQIGQFFAPVSVTFSVDNQHPADPYG